MAAPAEAPENLLDPSPPAAPSLCLDLRRKIQETAPGFDLNSAPIEPREKLTARVRLNILFSFRYDGKTLEAAGPLPSHVQAMPSDGALHGLLEERVSIAREEAGHLIEAWAGGAPGYRREPAPSEFLKQRPPFGLQRVCGKCSGTASITCTPCNGKRSTTCGGCQGMGSVNCHSCGGSGSVNCSVCAGRGWREEVYWMLDNYQQHQTAHQRTQVRQITCSSCGGSGKNQCNWGCRSGKTNCGYCAGTGNVACSNCGAKGSVACDMCGASGSTHRLGVVECSIAKQERLSVESGSEEDQTTLRERVPLEKLSELAPVKLSRARRDGETLSLDYEADVAVESARVSFGKDPIELRAYGPARQIFDYHGLGERLLSPGLRRLEESLKAGGLLGSVKNFLEPDIHAGLAQVPDGGSGISPASAAHIQNGLISESYARRAAAALGEAAPKIYGDTVRGRWAWFAGGTALAFILSGLAPKAGVSVQMARIGAALLSAGAWLALEFEARGNLRRLLGENFYGRLEGRFLQSRRRYRWLAAGIALAAWLLSLTPEFVQAYRRLGSAGAVWLYYMSPRGAGQSILPYLAVKGALGYAVYRLSKRLRNSTRLSATYCALAILPNLWAIPLIALLYQAARAFRRSIGAASASR